MSKTPRVDDREFAAIDLKPSSRVVYASFARQLETELADARAEIERLRQELRDNSTLAARQIVPAEMLVDDLTAEIERKDKLIEQMREALKLVDSVPLVFPKWFDGDDISVWDVVKAALSAAERDEG